MSASPTPSLSDSALSSSSSSLCETPDRVNEHLAVLLPKHLWKPDADAANCDNYYCRVPFNIFERRHHCRKCGGVYCAACTRRQTTLLDATHLDFLLPPRNVPISVYDSPISPVVSSRVCDDCWDQLHGLRTTPHTPARPLMKRALSHPFSTLAESLSNVSSRSSSPTQIKGPAFSRSLRNSPSHSSLRSGSTSSSSSSSSRRRTGVLRASQLQLPAELEKSYGELDAYPLRRSSVLCKATGGGRWEPKQSPVLDGYRPPVPGAKARFEIEMEKEEEEERKRRQNPIIIDGEFRYRFAQRQCPPPPVQTNSFSLSTF